MTEDQALQTMSELLDRVKSSGDSGGGSIPPIAPGSRDEDNEDMNRIARLESRVDDIDARLGRIEGGVADVKMALVGLDAKLDIGSIRSSVEKSHTDIYKWVATLAISVIGVMAAVYFGAQKISTHAPQAQISAPQPEAPARPNTPQQ